MKINSTLEKLKSYLKELTIVTAGVLIALFISNLKENNQALEYYSTSIETINNEVEANYSKLKGVVDTHIQLLDTLNKYGEDNITIIDLFKRVNGLEFATLNNTGVEFYTRSKINLIDFEMMSTLYEMRFLSKIIDSKLNRLGDFVYSNMQADSKDSKTVIGLYLSDVLNTEKQLLQTYKSLIDEKNNNR